LEAFVLFGGYLLVDRLVGPKKTGIPRVLRWILFPASAFLLGRSSGFHVLNIIYW
jgi:hypothetical protein